MYRVAKRAFDLVFSALGLIALSPVLLVLSLAVAMTDGFPILFRQQRVGQGGKLFSVLKFRSMAPDAKEKGPCVTAEGDSRITRLGKLMRKTKLDELPQLWNVLTGDMSFVGPRPEVPKYVEKYSAEQRRVLALKPGITDPATLEFRNEERLLAKAVNLGEKTREVQGETGTECAEEFYLHNCVPRKIQLSLAYAARANFWSDLVVILRTIASI